VIWAIRTLIWFSALTIALVAAATWLPAYLNRVQVPPDFEDIGGLTPMTGVWLTAPPYMVGNALAYRIGDGPEDVSFAFVAALPGNSVRMLGDELQVDGVTVSNWHPCGLYRGILEVGPFIVPAGHLFVVSKQHMHDSLVLGVIGPDQILGRVRE